MGTTEQRQLNIVSTKEVYSGTDRNGNPYTIREIEAVDGNTGAPLEYQAKTFQELPLGHGTFEVETYDHPKYGTSLTISSKTAPRGGGSSNGGGGGGGELAGRVQALEQEVATIKGYVKALGEKAGVDTRSASEKQSDDDIPF